MALFHRNVIVIDVSGESVLLSPRLLCQNMSQSRLVTSTEGGDGKIHHAKDWGKFRMTEHNKQSQEVGLQENLWPPCVSLKQLGRIRVYEKEEKAHIHMHRHTMIRGKNPNACNGQWNNCSYIVQINCLQTWNNVFFTTR